MRSPSSASRPGVGRAPEDFLDSRQIADVQAYLARGGFLVDGEQHYWVHVAIDRFTGQVVDKQIEVVNE